MLIPVNFKKVVNLVHFSQMVQQSLVVCDNYKLKVSRRWSFGHNVTESFCQRPDILSIQVCCGLVQPEKEKNPHIKTRDND